MIQDIAPHRYDNTYHIQKPGAQDYVFCIQRGRILLRETAEEHVLTIPRREEIEAAVPELMDRAVYLFSVDEKPYFLVSVPEKEAEEILDVTYAGTEMEIGFNVSYVLDVLNALKCENVRILLTDSVSSVQIEDAASQSAAYVVMPMRL